jgi:hypothetical protein
MSIRAGELKFARLSFLTHNLHSLAANIHPMAALREE